MFGIEGYERKILRINLSNQRIEKIPLNRQLTAGYIGGTGFCVKILYDETDPETDPLGPENRLVIATGLLSGTHLSASARFNIAAKSPLTGIWGESNSGGHFANELKKTGYDMIIIQGRAEKPSYIWIDDEDVEILDAKKLWGKTVWKTDEIVKKEHNDKKIQTLSIGQGGENLVLYAGMFNMHRAAARCGMGTVAGSKNLKAIAVRGSGKIRVADPDLYSQLVKEYNRQMKNSPGFKSRLKYGTMALVDPMNHIGRFPTKNHQTGVFPMAHKINGDTFLENFFIRNKSCSYCTVACKKEFMIKSGPYEGLEGENPEYETIDSFGALIWNDDSEVILRANWLCNQYGLDTTSTGSCIAFAMELWEKGILTEKDTGGIDFSWGNKKTIIEIIHKIAKREDFGDLLANGTKRAAKKIGKGSEKFAMNVKGLEIPAQDGRAQKSMAIAHAASARGADHLRHMLFYDEIGNEAGIIRRWGEQYLPEMTNRLVTKYKGIMAKDAEDYAALVNSMGMCVGWGRIMWFEDLAKLYTAMTGIRVDALGIQRIGERIVEQRRAYNIRLGLSRKDDNLPERFLKEPAPDGPCKGHIVDLKSMLDEYYTRRGYDEKTGLITRTRLEELNLQYVADELEQTGKIPHEK